ncbi:MAG TPA: hypothetical protein VFD43_05700, partial [Planctomycetota bacterium]|nr:hypothetical protein [Planctomycetota bacterium]
MAAQALIGWKLATGVFLADDRLVVTQVTRTPLGVKGAETVEERVEDGDVAAALQRLRAQGRLKGAIVCGIDARRDVSITRKLTPDDVGRQPAALLASQLGFAEESLVAVKETFRLPTGVFGLLSACPRPVAAQLLAGLGGGRGASVRLTSVTAALHERA